jgi:hypothetical protein
MEPTVVIEADPVRDDLRSVLLIFKATPMRALLVCRPDKLRNHTVLLCTVRCVEAYLDGAAHPRSGSHLAKS